MGHAVTVLTVALIERANTTAGLARRLRTVAINQDGQARELPLYEGKSSLNSAQVFVLGVNANDQKQFAAILESATAVLVKEGILRSDVVVGWGESSALALGQTAASSRLFVLPGKVDPLGATEPPESSLLAAGIATSNTIVTPSPSAARALVKHPGASARASDQAIVSIRFGCDDPAWDPGNDAALAARYSADAPAGKAECRKALVRRTSVSVGTRTLVLACPPLREANEGAQVLAALGDLSGEDVAIVIPGHGDRALLDKANVLAIERPGRIAVLAGDHDRAAAERQLLAGADVLLLSGKNDPTGRAAGRALRYGVLPVAPDDGAFADFLVDYDEVSETGSSILYPDASLFSIKSAIRRAVALRAHPDRWESIVTTALGGTPRWATTAALLDSLKN